MATPKDATTPIRRKAGSLPDVIEGTSCTQTSFKVGKTAFLYIGMQGGRYKAMFKLEASKVQAAKLAAKEPDNFGVGNTAWVTARFSDDEPLPKTIWEKWLKESYALCTPAAKGLKTSTTSKRSQKKTTKKKTVKRVAKKVKKKSTASKKKTKKKNAAK